jgi:hypothetical protein
LGFPLYIEELVRVGAPIAALAVEEGRKLRKAESVLLVNKTGVM